MSAVFAQTSLLSSRASQALVLAALGCAAAVPARAADMTPDQRAFFENKIRPVLVKQCYECHSVDAKKIGGRLLLDSPPEMITGGESGPALVPGRPDESLLIQALLYEGAEMPPDKPLPPQVVNDFITWVKMGAPDPRPALPKTARAIPVTEDKAALWSYQPVTNPAPPVVKDTSWPRDPMDHFVLAPQEQSGAAHAQDASARTLLRRLSFDLTGLPPTFEETESFVREFASSTQPRQVYARLVDRLLESPHFGERWGRHWLDVARYGESNGNDGLSRNASFAHAWRYRDYVIQAFNEDTPYDRFVTEQIAGDLLPADSPSRRDRHLVATGFLAIGSKPAKAMNPNFEMDVVADQIEAVGSGIMALSVGCARCHDHKTDPIPTRDYYALAGIFKSTETLWGPAGYEALTAPQTPLHTLQAAPPVRPRPELEPVILARTSASKKQPARPAFPSPADAPLAMGVREAKTPADCRLNIGGDSASLGPAVPRGFLSACGTGAPAPEGKQSGRLELARWLTSPSHPQTARVMVNRIWLHLFGAGLVRTPDDFGVYGDRPSHPALLDHLASRFMADGWSVKRMIRAIVLSRTYQMDSTAETDADPANALLTRHERRRLDAESFRDTILAVTGRLDRTPAQGSLIQQRDLLVNVLGDIHQPSRHRSIYLLMLRNSMPPELTAFNLPDGTSVAGLRDVTTLPTQALYLLNSPFLIRQSRHLAARIATAAGDDSESRIRLACRLTLARDPTDEEISDSLNFIREADAMLASSSGSADPHPAKPGAPEISDPWSAFCQALLAGNEVRYVE